MDLAVVDDAAWRDLDGLRFSDQPRREPGRRWNFDLPSLATFLDAERPILWAWMLDTEHSCATTGRLRDARHLQMVLRTWLDGAPADTMPFRWLVWGSRAVGAWSMGGDLATFTRLIRSRDEAGLRRYAHDSVEVLFENHRGMGLPVMTAALIQGDAVGGGFEAMLTNDLVVAETGTRFGLPEILFNLFPGMGAWSLLRRKVGEATARRLIEDGRTRTAEELAELGLIDHVCAKGEGEAVLCRTIEERAPRFAVELALKRVRQRSDPVTRQELTDIVELWAELAMNLAESDLRRMELSPAPGRGRAAP